MENLDELENIDNILKELEETKREDVLIKKDTEKVEKELTEDDLLILQELENEKDLD
ncbi:hypothetical protein N3114_12740 (plasmid) [Aliarcobacter butzleri]|uniref:hypothetical protein n=1 Tax=Aliarcobacter butzleri TaxID=28197 RepID=UPI0021B27773|nr:hypothetical protein [Aliarcobacter butzleri]UXC30722.1 hypothetical protein N3114_12740 [Aliarcobacter butzleri]